MKYFVTARENVIMELNLGVHTLEFISFSLCNTHISHARIGLKGGGFTLVVTVGGVRAICEHL